MKLKQLESALSNLNPSFPNPKIQLEQYPTSAHLAAAVALTAYNKGDVFLDKNSGQNCRICDLGCGTGMLSMAFALVLNYLAEIELDSSDDEDREFHDDGSVNDQQVDNENESEDNVNISDAGNFFFGEVVGIDVCEDALECAEENKNRLMELEYLEENLPIINFIRTSLQYEPPIQEMRSSRSGGRGRGRAKDKSRNTNKGRGSLRQHDRKKKQQQESQIQRESKPYSTLFHTYNDDLPFPSHSFDTVITNPPFGTKHNEGIDVAFLAAACRLSRKAVYSFHKSSTREYLLNLIENEWKSVEGVDLGIEVVAQMKFEIQNMYKFHKEKSVDVDVDLIRVFHKIPPTSSSVKEAGNVQEEKKGRNDLV